LGPHIFKDLVQLKRSLQEEDRELVLERLNIIQHRLVDAIYPGISPDTCLEYVSAGLSSIRRDVGEDWGRAEKLVHLVILEVEDILGQGLDQDLDMGIIELSGDDS
jgi:hypothetical protein